MTSNTPQGGNHSEPESFETGGTRENSTSLTRRNFLVVASTAAATVLFGSMISGCSQQKAPGSGVGNNIDYSNWNGVLEAAKGKTVSWYGWGGSEPRNTWITTVLAPALKEKYQITLNLVGMGINDILTKLSGEMQAGVKEGSIDFIWINGENFFSAKQNGYIWGPFTDYLPSFNAYIDKQSPEVLYDFGSPVEGYEAPYGKAQMQMWIDSSKVQNPPKNSDEFLAFCQQYPGQITYPEPGDFTGTAFISCLIAGVIGKSSFEVLSSLENPTLESVKEVVSKGLDYLRSLNPYLWKRGTTFPADLATVDTMYADGELVMNMGYGAPEALVRSGALAPTTRSFIFDTGTVGNTNFMAIAKNSANKAAAMVAINELMSPEMQLSQYKNLTNISVLDMSKLSDGERRAFDDVELGVSQLPLKELLDHRIVEAAGPVIPLLEELWHKEVVGK